MYLLAYTCAKAEPFYPTTISKYVMLFIFLKFHLNFGTVCKHCDFHFLFVVFFFFTTKVETVLGNCIHFSFLNETNNVFGNCCRFPFFENEN